MPQEPKKRHSRQRQGKRRFGIKLKTPTGIICANCGALTLPYIVCKECGYYKDRQVLTIKQKVNEKK